MPLNIRRGWSISPTRDSDATEQTRQRRLLDDELTRWGRSVLETQAEAFRQPAPRERQPAPEGPISLAQLPSLFTARRREPDLGAVAEGFAPRDTLDLQGEAFRGRAPLDVGAQRASAFAQSVAALPEPDRVRLRAVARVLDQRGLKPFDLVRMAQARPPVGIGAPGLLPEQTSDQQTFAEIREAIDRDPEVQRAGATGVRAQPGSFQEQALAGTGDPTEALLGRERLQAAAGGDPVTGIINAFQKEVELLRPVTEPVGEFIAGPVAENVPVVGPLVGMVPEGQREAVGSEAAAQLAVPSNIVGPLGVIKASTVFRNAARLVGREAAENAARKVASEFAGTEAIAEALPVEPPIRRGAAAEASSALGTEPVAASRFGAEAVSVPPARAGAEAAPPARPEFGTEPPPQFGTTRPEFRGEQGGLQERMFTSAETGQQGQIGLEDTLTARGAPFRNVLRDITEERTIAREIRSPRAGALDQEEAILRDWEQRGVTSQQGQATAIREMEQELENEAMRLEARTPARARPYAPTFGTTEAAEQEIARRGRRPAAQRREMVGAGLTSEQVRVRGEVLDSLRARLGLEPPSPGIEDVLPRFDPDAPPIERPAAVGGGTEAFASPLRDMEQVAGEVVTSENPIVRAVVGRTGINPSVLESDPLGRATVAYWRQRVAGEQLADVALAAASDVHAQRFTGLRPNIVIPQSGKGAGMIRNVTPKAEGASRAWQDVYSRPGSYTMKPAQQAEIDDYLRVVDETEFLRVQAGLPPRATRGAPAVADGWFYVPRQVKGIRGVELRRPSNASLQRHYEEAAEGIARGVKYDANPRATLELHVRNAYREIADKQFSDYVEKLQAEAMQRGERLFLTPKELVPEAVAQRMANATTRRLAAERARRSLTVSRGIEGIDPAAAKGLRRTATVQRRAAQTELDAARTEYQSAKNVYSKAMEAARKAEVAPGTKFGQDNGTIPISMWRNRFFPREQAERLKQGIDEFFKPIESSPFVKGAMTVGNTVRFLSAVGDFAEPFIQGQLVFGANPKVWARATLRHYQGFLDPTVQARIVRDYLPEFQEMAAHGTPIGDQEFFVALREGGGPSAGKLLEILPKGKEARSVLQNAGRQTFGRFQASYNTGLASSRAGLTRSLKNAIPDAADRQATIRNLTGGLDSRALGVGPGRRSVEGFALAFSPRLLRSTVALIGDLRLGLRNPRGLAAYRSLGTLAASATGLYVLSGLALGKDWEEIREGLNPLNGKKFLSHEINGDWIGIGGQVRSITQLMSKVAADPTALASLDTFDNPLISFYQSRGAPALNIVGGGVEALTGADTAPYDQIENLPDFFRHLGTSALPFAVQGILEGQNAVTSLAGLGGARTSAGTNRENFDRLYQEKHGTAPNPDISPRTLDPDLAREAGYSEETDFSQERTGLLEPETRYLADAARIAARNPNTAMEQFATELGDYFRTRSGVTTALVADLGLPEREASLAQDYYELDPRDRRDPETGQPDWDYFESQRERILQQIAREDANAARRLREGSNVQFSDPELQRVYDAHQTLKDGLDAYYDTDSKQREAFRRRNPELDAKLYLLGRVSRVVSASAQARVRALSRRLLGTEVEAGRGQSSGGGPIRIGGPEPIRIGR